MMMRMMVVRVVVLGYKSWYYSFIFGMYYVVTFQIVGTT